MVFKESYRTPRGFSDMMMMSDGAVLTGLHFVDSRKVARRCRERAARDVPVFRETRRWLDEYFGGHAPSFTPEFRIDGLTPFRKDVIDVLLKIPFGQTTTYGDIAAAIAKKRGMKKMSAQAVGDAVGHNPICIIVPCHRVVGSAGNLTGYRGGIMRKNALLELEGNDMNLFTVPTKGTAL